LRQRGGEPAVSSVGSRSWRRPAWSSRGCWRAQRTPVTPRRRAGLPARRRLCRARDRI